MKIYDKKGFFENIAIFLFFGLLSASLSYFTDGDFSYAPSAVIIYGTVSRILETLSEEKTKINLEHEQQQKEIMERHFGRFGKLITNLSFAALIISVVVMHFNFIIGLVMIIITIFIHNTVTKSANEELRQANETAKQKKQNLKNNL